MPSPPRSPLSARRRVAIVAEDAGLLLHTRTPLIEAIVGRGHQLLCIAARASADSRTALQALGAQVADFDVGAARLRALGDRRAIAGLGQSLTDWQPNSILALGLKPLLMSALAARALSETRVVGQVYSLAAAVPAGGERPGLGVRWTLSRAMGRVSALIASSAAVEAELRGRALVPAGLEIAVVPVPGVDLRRWSALELPPLDGGLVFAMPRGRESVEACDVFAEAARRVGEKWPGARFIFAGPGDAGGGSGAGPSQVAAVGPDVRAGLAQAHIVVVPGTSESAVVDAAVAIACARPLIAADVAGCRDIVDERVSGVLVPPGDAVALARAMESFLRRPADVAWMGRAARRKAERRLDANEVDAHVMRLMGLPPGA
jgi:hypothetical protein